MLFVRPWSARSRRRTAIGVFASTAFASMSREKSLLRSVCETSS
jgi:hypothetical protein